MIWINEAYGNKTLDIQINEYFPSIYSRIEIKHKICFRQYNQGKDKIHFIPNCSDSYLINVTLVR